MWEHQERKFGYRRRSDTVGPCVVQISVDLWPASLVCTSGSGMCEDGFAGDDAPYAVCLSIDDNPEMPGTTDQKDSNEGAEGAGSCVYACAGFAGDDVHHVIFPSIVGGYNMPGIMFGMDQKDSSSSDEVQIKRCNVTAVADDTSCLFRDLDPTMDEY